MHEAVHSAFGQHGIGSSAPCVSLAASVTRPSAVVKSVYLHDADWVVCLAEADDCMQDGLLHGVILGLGLVQASCQSMLCLPLLQ